MENEQHKILIGKANLAIQNKDYLKALDYYQEAADKGCSEAKTFVKKFKSSCFKRQSTLSWMTNSNKETVT